MAPTDHTSSPRDHTADANEDLARKKQRLSEDSGAPSDESVIIEACEPEDIGTNMDNAIEIEDDPNASMEPYSHDFVISATVSTPLEQIRNLDNKLVQNYYISQESFVYFSRALTEHISRTIDDRDAWRQHYVEDEAEFFAALASTSYRVLIAGDLFEPSVEIESPGIRKALHDLLDGLTTLCGRIIPLLPDAIRAALSRRDSAQVTTKQHSLGLLRYLAMAVSALSPDSLTLEYLQRCDRRLKLPMFLAEGRSRFADAGVVSALASIIRLLSSAAREVKDSWAHILQALTLFSISMNQLQTVEVLPKQEVEEVMEVVKETIVPAICGKHPRALPNDFHEAVVNFGRDALLLHGRLHERASASELYERFVKSSTDSLIPEAADNGSTLDSLWRVAGEDQDILAQILAVSWSLQTTKAFICSDIMDIRNVGVNSLGTRLVKIYTQAQATSEGLEHPIVQYAVRFLRKNEITGYIFGPESRAGLINQSSEIIAFLAATYTYTNAETDVIWRACSTSVEADFVKAAFRVLRSLLQWLDPGLLLHLANKYCATPIASLGIDAVEFLQTLFQEIEKKSLSLTDQADRLALIFTSIRILRHADASEPSALANRLRQFSLAEICRLNTSDFWPEDRTQVYSHCVPEILGHSENATAAFEILNILMEVRLSPQEAQYVLSILPIKSPVEELCEFVDASKGKHHLTPYILGTIVRLTCIVRLTDLEGAIPDADTQARLFSHIFGSASISNEARDAAWDKLDSMASISNLPSAASDLRKSFLHDHIPSLSATLATPRLIHLIYTSLKVECAKEEVKQDMTKLLQFPLWKSMVRFATTSLDNVVKVAVSAMVDLLFISPSILRIPPASVTQCHGEFVRGHIESTCHHFSNLVQSKEPAHYRTFLLDMTLLGLLLNESRKILTIYSSPKESDVLLVGDKTSADDGIAFVAQVHGPETQPAVIEVQAKESTKVAELLAALSTKTGAKRNRVIAGGIEITDMADESLPDAGVRQSGLVLVCPKYTLDLDLDKVLTRPGPVEQEILTQYSSIEAFLDGPDQVAEVAYRFLQSVRLPAESRLRVVSSDTTAQELFPPDKQFRTLFSLFVLRKHIHDWSRLGVADSGFIWRAIRLLTGFILDESRAFSPTLMLDVTRVLALFLRERSTAGHLEPYFEDTNRFVSRMVTLLLESKSMPIDQPYAPGNVPLRTELAAVIYSTLLQACQTDECLWKAFTSIEDISSLHSQILLDEDVGFSARLARPIRNLCEDTSISKDVPNFYWHAIIPGLWEALSKSPWSESYFDLAVDILHADQVMQSDEGSIRDLIQRLTSKLQTYQHVESPTLLLADKGMSGLLRLLVAATSILKSHKKPLELDGLPARLFRDYLFPKADGVKRMPLAHESTRALVYDLIRSSFTLGKDYEELVNVAYEATEDSVRNAGARFPGLSEWLRSSGSSAGLTNLGMTCYMNSLLQQMYGNLQFRKFVFDQPILDFPRQDILAKLQLLFAQMQNSNKPVTDSANLAGALSVQVGVQEDVHTFYTTLLSRLEDAMPDSESKAALTRFFTGKSVTQVRGECGHVSSRHEPFTELSVTVKNKASLQDSLGEFVQGEPLEGANKYMCMSCESSGAGRLVNAMKRTCLDDVPDSLTLCLKRFAFDNMLDGENKVNDRFEFPPEIDMSRYSKTYLENPEAPQEPDIFELVGVIVHQGSLSYGHYWSYVRVPGLPYTSPDAWLYVEDTKSMRCAGGIREVQEQCFGGLTWPDGTERPESAYVLFYQRKDFISQAKNLNIIPKELHNSAQILPRVNVSGEAGGQVDESNLWQLRIATLFDNQFGSFVTWLLGQYPALVEAEGADSDSQGTSTDTGSITEPQQSDLDGKIGNMAASYAFRILLSEPAAEKKMGSLVLSLSGVLTARPAVAVHFLEYMLVDDYGFSHILQNKSRKVRTKMFELLLMCTASVREHNANTYEQLVSRMIAVHASLLGPSLEASLGRWNEYLAFAASFARVGSLETRIVLDCGYLDFAFEIIRLRWDQNVRKKYNSLVSWQKTNKLDYSPIFDFLYELLSGHVDLSVNPDRISNHAGMRLHTPNGWCLLGNELHRLFTREGERQVSFWPLLFAGIRQCPTQGNWRDYAPGKLIGLLVSNKVHHTIYHFVEGSLNIHFDVEDQELLPLLFSALHFCLNRTEQECAGVLQNLSKNLVLWDGFEKRCLYFFREAYMLVPVAVIDSVPIWASKFLNAKSLLARKATVDWLRDHVFGPTPLSENAERDVVRIRSTRAMVKQCYDPLKDAYGTEQSRGRFDAMIEAMESAREYLVLLQEGVAERQQQLLQQAAEGGDAIPALSTAIQVECDECRAVLEPLTELLIELRDWEPLETALPTRSVGVRKSVELEEEGDDDDLGTGTSEVEYEDGSSELGS
ncbi:hypothetical protein LTR37_005303 [Vermiconidia calcicola]|uniref:Uncharacterized protein n=1 Tax=Vermiconidia calcicola TaxID=1690605 RepID=A0ACC3NMJ4_9PEZI|nr:hypothetical protein LTR37_005303 [Vermiconidia calcicola]